MRIRFEAKTLGRLGELLVAWFYRLRGYSVLARNLHLRSGEIDLVARRGRTLVIAEVKSRQSLSAGAGHHAVDRRKRERLVRLADEFLARFPRRDDFELRYDVVSLRWTGLRFAVSQYADAFRPVANVQQPWRWCA